MFYFFKYSQWFECWKISRLECRKIWIFFQYSQWLECCPIDEIRVSENRKSSIISKSLRTSLLELEFRKNWKKLECRILKIFSINREFNDQVKLECQTTVKAEEFQKIRKHRQDSSVEKYGFFFVIFWTTRMLKNHSMKLIFLQIFSMTRVLINRSILSVENSSRILSFN